MAFTHTTDLGRRVPLEDWRSFHRDRLLSTLYSMRDSGGDDNGLTFAQISSVTGLNEFHAIELVNSMKDSKPKLVDLRVVSLPYVVVITARGIRWVEESPHAPSRL